jgi:predicted CxxxxCH...CXXCH cytochrome family protein
LLLFFSLRSYYHRQFKNSNLIIEIQNIRKWVELFRRTFYSTPLCNIRELFDYSAKKESKYPRRAPPLRIKTMCRLLMIIIVIQIGLVACSTSNTEAPGPREPHPAQYILDHGEAANDNLSGCQVCHGIDFKGISGTSPSCLECHPAGPPFTMHTIPYTDPVDHGPAAKANLYYCQECHGEPGTIRFDGGIDSTGCSAAGCHPDAGAHPVRWQGSTDDTLDYLSSHRNSGRQSITCSICHDFTEGRPAPNPVAPSCYSAEFTNADNILSGCHADGPATAHAIPFTDPELHGPEAKADLTYCQKCHATPFDGGPGSNPRFNLYIGGLADGCEDCHSKRTAHPLPWMGAIGNSHKAAGNFQAACALCHGANLLGTAEGGVGKACSDCHLAGDPLVDQNCVSCHNDPPDDAFPAGDERPNRSGSHALHNGLNRVTGQCIACHNGSGTDTEAHFDNDAPANVAILASYRAESGGFSYNSGDASCSGVSCHGGQPTQNWVSGTIDVDTDCRECHERGTDQYNSFNSGEHKKHVSDKNIFCTVCHDPQKLNGGHFVGLDTKGFEQPADETIQDILNYDSGRDSCGVGSIGNIGCHENSRAYDWFDDD